MEKTFPPSKLANTTNQSFLKYFFLFFLEADGSAHRPDRVRKQVLWNLMSPRGEIYSGAYLLTLWWLRSVVMAASFDEKETEVYDSIRVKV